MRQKADKKHHELNKLSYCYVGMYINRYNANMIPPYQGDASDTLLTSFFSFLPRFEIDLWKHFAKVRYNFYLRKVSFTMVVWTVKLFFSVLRLFNYLLTLTSITLKDFSCLVSIFDSFNWSMEGYGFTSETQMECTSKGGDESLTLTIHLLWLWY